MKISAAEFARLTELLAKGDALSAEEQTEKATIESRIVAEDGEGPGGGDPAPEPEPAPAADPEPEPEPEAPAADKPSADPVDDEKAFASLSLGNKFKALIASRAGLLAKLNAATGQVSALGTQLAAATQRATDAEAALATARADLATAQSRVTALEAETKDLHVAVTDELSSIGVTADKLPGVEATGSEGTPSSEAELEERLKECQSHAERVALVRAFKKSQATKAKAA